MPAPHTPLLGRLAGYFTEVITTDALRLLLDDPPSRVAFLDLVGDAVGVDLSMVRSFERERGIEGGWRLDLEGLDAGGRPRLIVEAKIGHLITLDQMRTYVYLYDDSSGMKWWTMDETPESTTLINMAETRLTYPPRSAGARA